ncbi:MAG: (d)CMP kinase [Bacteroidales bacterium]|nr:(d)CMP kinase [Bacteroidales bacterium]
MENHSFQSSPQNSPKANIVLVGFSGAGKSTVGRKIANRLSFSFIDTDRYFEEKYRFTIFNFFKNFGEELFRRLEREILLEVLDFENVVIATGGGTPCFFDNMDIINQKSTSIYIEMSPVSLSDRLWHSKKPRPLTHNMSREELDQYISTKLTERSAFYKKAQYTIKGENIDIDPIIGLYR